MKHTVDLKLFRILRGAVVGLGVMLLAPLAQAEIVGDAHIQSDADNVRLDIDSRTYGEVLEFFDEGYPTASVLLHAVSMGISIDDAVYLATKANADDAAEIYSTAIGMLPSLPGWVCHAGGSASGRFHRDIKLTDLPPQPTLQSVADRFFDNNERLAPFPDWQAGQAHMNVSVAELKAKLGPAFWYQLGNSTGGSQPVFVSLYRGNRAIVVDDNLGQVAKAEQQGVTELPVVIVYNDGQFSAVSELGPDATLNEVANRFFSGGVELTAVPKWEKGDFHLEVLGNEFGETFILPKKEDIPADKWAAIVSDLQQNGFKKQPAMVSLMSNNRMWLDEPERITAAQDLGMEKIPTLFLYHGINRLACGLPASTCADLICDAAVAAGADPTVCDEAPGAGATRTLAAPPPPPGGGVPSDS